MVNERTKLFSSCSLALKWHRWNGCDNQYHYKFLCFVSVHITRWALQKTQREKTHRKSRKRHTLSPSLYLLDLISITSKKPILLMHIVINYECVFFLLIRSFLSVRMCPFIDFIWFFGTQQPFGPLESIKKSSYLHFFFLIDIDMEIWLRGFEMIMSSSELNFRRRRNIKRMNFLSHFFLRRKWFFFSSMLRKSRTFEFMSQFSAYKLNISIMIRDWIFFKMHLVSDKIRENTPNDF